MAKVQVPQADGEVRISVAGDEPKVFPVEAGVAEVADEDLELFLACIEGAQLVDSETTQ